MANILELIAAEKEAFSAFEAAPQRGTSIEDAALAWLDASSALETERVRPHIEAQAKDSAAGLLNQGWTGDPSAYDLGNFPGDRAALEARLGRDAALEERRELTYAIRAALAQVAS